ncbi:MAG: hypothetical protein ABI315_01040 [Bacteroidia bacterium]
MIQPIHKFTFLFIFLSINIHLLKSQEEAVKPEPKKKGSFYVGWGYNKDWFSKSDLHFKNTSNEYNPITKNNDYYNFTVYNAKAKDRTGFKDILHTDLTIPQYVYRIGYFFNKKYDLGIEINFDHVKYVVRDYQTLRVKGLIKNQIIDQDTLISPIDFLHFEHTNGANFMMLNFVKRQQFISSKKGNHHLSGIAKIGAGIVIPKTDVFLFGQEVDNRFHIAGYCMGFETGLRYDAFKYLYLEYTGKIAFANYTNVLVIGAGKAHHTFWTLENILVLGLQIPL